MVATELTTTEMGKMGKGAVYESGFTIPAHEIQGTAQFICTLVIGMSVKLNIFIDLTT